MRNYDKPQYMVEISCFNMTTKRKGNFPFFSLISFYIYALGDVEKAKSERPMSFRIIQLLAVDVECESATEVIGKYPALMIRWGFRSWHCRSLAVQSRAFSD